MEKETIESQLNSLLNAYIECVETQSRQFFDEVWSTEGTCRMISGQNMFEGRESIWEDFIVGKVGASYESIDLVKEDVWFEVVDGAHALIIFKYHTECVMRDTGEPFGVAGLETQVAVRQAEGWRLQHVHYSK